MRLTWIGHACFLLLGSRKVLVDPFFPDEERPEHPDMVALTHGHRDHLGETIRLGCRTIAINETAKILAKQGLSTRGMNIGGTVIEDGVTFTMTPAFHSGGLDLDGTIVYGGGAAGYVIGMDGVQVYHAGDTGLFSDMKLIGELYHPDVALLPIGSTYTMGPSEAMMAAQFIGAPLVIPMHYSTWPVIEQDPIAFKTAIERTTDLRVAVLKPGESLQLEAKKY
ncbi:MAG: metal-dependent hydrolase, partial [Methanomicrobiales archaeon]|nr:metal-dependent hydrolase [Methanomicrobiales archaeon]